MQTMTFRTPPHRAYVLNLPSLHIFFMSAIHPVLGALLVSTAADDEHRPRCHIHTSTTQTRSVRRRPGGSATGGASGAHAGHATAGHRLHQNGADAQGGGPAVCSVLVKSEAIFAPPPQLLRTIGGDDSIFVNISFCPWMRFRADG